MFFKRIENGILYFYQICINVKVDVTFDQFNEFLINKSIAIYGTF